MLDFSQVRKLPLGRLKCFPHTPRTGFAALSIFASAVCNKSLLFFFMLSSTCSRRCSERPCRKSTGQLLLSVCKSFFEILRIYRFEERGTRQRH